MNVQVITSSSRVPTESYYYLSQFKESARRNGIEPHFLDELPWKGLMTKPKSLRKYLKREGAKFDAICMVDAWDIIFVSGMESIVAKFKGLDAPIVFNAERSCFPDGKLAEHHPMCSSPYRYLNSGFFIGYTEAVMDMIEGMDLDNRPDDILPDGRIVNTNDQDEFMRWFLANQTKAKLDTDAFICQSTHASEADEFYQSTDYGNRIASKVTGNFPCCFHGNGSGKDWLRKIVGWLNL